MATYSKCSDHLRQPCSMIRNIVFNFSILLVTFGVVVFNEISQAAAHANTIKFTAFEMPKSIDLLNAASQWPHNHIISAGTEFIMAFPNSLLSIVDTSSTENLTLIIYNPSTVLAQITVSSIYPSFSTRNVSLPAKQTTIIDIDPVSIQTNYGNEYINNVTTEPKGILIRSTQSVQIIATNEDSIGGSGDAYMLLPTCQLGMRYKMFGDEAPPVTTRIFTIVATEDNTNITYDAYGLSPSPRSVMLNRLQTHTYSTNEYYTTGMTVTADKKVAVFSGSVCGLGLIYSSSCDFMMVQLKDTSKWGTSFPIVTLVKANVTEYTLVPNVDNTQVYQDDLPLVTINANRYLRGPISTSVISTSSPVEIIQVGHKINSSYGDPFFLPVIPENQFINVSTQFMTSFNTYNQTFILHFLRITTLISSIGLISVDGATPISPLLYTQIGRSRYYYYETQIASGIHTLTPSNGAARYSAVVYGYGNAMAYGFAVGVDLPGSNC